MRIVVCPDSFKGSFSASDFCKVAKSYWGKETLTIMPMADGGEGSLITLTPFLPDAEEIIIPVADPLGRKINATYLNVNKTAYVELAQASGFALVNDKKRDIMKSNTLGAGQLMAHAIASGCREIVLFAGGSATNDGGMGIAHALGVEFYDDAGRILYPFPSSMAKVSKIDLDHAYKTNITLATDVVNTLHGPMGAAYIYARQKGANEAEIEMLDLGLKHLGQQIQECNGKDLENVPGLGAAGGIGACLSGLFNASILSATTFIVELTKIETMIKAADLVVTGEGCFDDQSLNGKLVGHILSISNKYNVPCLIVTGKKATNYQPPLSTIYELSQKEMPLQYNITHGLQLLKNFFNTHAPSIFVT